MEWAVNNLFSFVHSLYYSVEGCDIFRSLFIFAFMKPENDFYLTVYERWEIDDASPNWNAFVEALRAKVLDLYLHNPEKLIQILYRLDVPEQQFIHATELNTPIETAEFLARKIIDRELKRYYFRKNFKP